MTAKKRLRRPYLAKRDYFRRRTGQRWFNYKCSECDRELDKTARFCVECGAWFTNRRGKR